MLYVYYAQEISIFKYLLSFNYIGITKTKIYKKEK